MGQFLLVGYRIKPGDRSAVGGWFVSETGRDILQRMQSETNVGYVCTYLTTGVQPSDQAPGEFDAFDLWEAPDRAAFRRLAESPAYREFEERFHSFIVDKSWKQFFVERLNA